MLARCGLALLCTFLCSQVLVDAFLFHQFTFGGSSENASWARQQQSELSSEEPEGDELADCPVECDCVKVAQIADCSNRSLTRVPARFPRDIRRIRLERNNISELGPFAFRNLRRLQRVDLSNNKLAKIDPLAFAGGHLQSLSSLILFGNRLSQLPAGVFSELPQLQLLLLNTNQLRCIPRELFHSLSNLNLLSLYDNNIETLANGTFDGLRNIKTIHLGKNPLQCDCNLRWLADYLESNPIETSEARCESPARNQAKKLSQLSQQKFRCEAGEEQTSSQCNAVALAPKEPESCPMGCFCSGSTVDCSRVSQADIVQRPASPNSLLELPEIPDDVPVYVTRMRINDNRIKRIRQTALFRRLANSQKLDLGNNKIVDIEDNAIGGSPKPERVVFVLLENEHCSAKSAAAGAPEDPCASAPKVNPPTFDSPCYNGGSCLAGSGNRATPTSNYTCLCPLGFAGPLCEINIDDCAQHQCQNGAMCVDGVNSYKCLCRDPTTTGEFCEQLNSPLLSSSSGSLSNAVAAPVALPMVAPDGSSSASAGELAQQQQPILARSADFKNQVELTGSSGKQSPAGASCKRLTKRTFYLDGNGCQSVRVLKLSECLGTCASSPTPAGQHCCAPAKVKRRRIRMQCNDGASYVKTIDLVKKCACSTECSADFTFTSQQQTLLSSQFNATQEDQLLQITRLDAVD